MYTLEIKQGYNTITFKFEHFIELAAFMESAFRYADQEIKVKISCDKGEENNGKANEEGI